MASVSQLVEEVAKIMREPTESVNAYARALIDAGQLPKSRGRAIAQVSPRDIVALFTALCLEPKIKDAGETVRSYLDMRQAGVPSGAPAGLSMTAGEALTELAAWILGQAKDRCTPEERKAAFGFQITFVQNWPEITVRDEDGALMMLFKSGNPQFWEGFHKRETTLSARAILMLGSDFWGTAD